MLRYGTALTKAAGAAAHDGSSESDDDKDDADRKDFRPKEEASKAVTAAGTFVFELRGHVSGVNYFTGVQVFTSSITEAAEGCTQLYYRSGIVDAPVLDSVFVVSCKAIYVRSAVTGKQLLTIPVSKGAVWLDSAAHIVFSRWARSSIF
jgi:hypothetical protein